MSDELLEACRAQHQAIDYLFAMLIELTRSHPTAEPFMPSKSGQPWEAMQQGHRAMFNAQRARGRVLLEIPMLDAHRLAAVVATAQPGRLRVLEAMLGRHCDGTLPVGARLCLRISLEELVPGVPIDYSRSVEWPRE